MIDGWPFEAEAITVVDGAMDALDRVAQVVVRLGDRVVVEHPRFPPLLDLLDELGADVIGVDVDDEGPIVAAVRGRAAPTAGRRLPATAGPEPHGGQRRPPSAGPRSPRRSPGTATIVIEDDHSGDIATGALVSLGSSLPQRTVHIRSYSKSHGPDLRLAAVGGAGDVVTAVANRRLFGPGWSSRILQAVLLEMLDDPATIATVAIARNEYARRRQLVAGALEPRDVEVTGSDGINLWMTRRR